MGDPPDAAHERIQSVEKALQDVQPHDADGEHATHDGSHQPGDRCEAKVLALSRDFNEMLSEKMRAAILISRSPARAYRAC